MIFDHAQQSQLAVRSPAISHSQAAMGPVAVVVLLSVWTGTAGQVSITVEKLSSKGSPCHLEIRCFKKMSFGNFQWYENDRLINNDKRHNITYGGVLLTVTPSSTNTMYKCSEKSSKEEMSIDVAPTCDPTILKTVPGLSSSCSVQLLAIKIACLCLWLTALGYTTYYCKRQTSQKAAQKRTKATEEGVYSHVGMSELGGGDNPPQEEEKAGPSQAKQTANPTYQSLQKTEENDDYSLLTPKGTPASAQDPTYQALAKDKDDTYNTLQKPASSTEAVVTPAMTEEISPQGEAKT